jgi:alpha-1,3-rhamnosyl/mannosyltransferase
MACGTPVVASRASCLPEVAEGAAVLIDPASVESLSASLEQTLSDPEFKARLIEQGFVRAREYTWRAAAERLLGVYKTVAAA